MLDRAIQRLKRTYRITRDYGSLKDSPRDRLQGLLIHLFKSRELPNIILGGALSFSISAGVGSASWTAAGLAWVVWLVSLANYVIAEEVVAAYKAYNQEFHDNSPGIY